QARQIQQIVDTVPAGILLLAPDLHILLANPAAREHLAALCGGEDFGALNQAAETPLTHLGGHPIEELLAPPTEGLWHEVEVDGPPRRVFEVAAYAVTSGPEAESWVLVLQDVTQEREIKERIQQQERLAVVGQLAAGIAHDFNNIMSVIILYADMILRKPGLSPKDRERLVTISQQARQATNLTGQILDFSRTSVIERHPLDLTPFLKELINLLKRTLPENIELELAYGHDEYTVSADPTRIQQAIMNLVVNARDAMPEGGKMRIELERIRVEPSEPPPLPEMEPGEWVRVTASDTGTGIPPNVLSHIFEPFFTTKPIGQGTGLGLAQVYGIVGQHEGHIDVESEIGRGTTFTIYLPALRVFRGEPSELKIDAPVQGHGEMILVVEDEPAARDAVADTLQSLGYQVLVATNGREALSIFEQHVDEIALVLSDLMMPGISGTELFRILKQKKPAVKIVAMTGYPLQFKARDLPVQDIVDWLQKPLSAEQLAETVQRALET
ncbi:MAG: response regulator, partial [Anaerolineales bacterium]